jgi:hypothetical protein
MANEAFEAAVGCDDLDLEVYDNDGNGYVRRTGSSLEAFGADMDKVDAFVVIHAGQGAERTGDAIDLWSVKWTLPKAREADGQCIKWFELNLMTDTSQVSRYMASCRLPKMLPAVFARMRLAI